MRKLIISVLLIASLNHAKAYYGCYTDKCDKVRLKDRVKRLNKKLSNTSETDKQSKIKIDIEEALTEIKAIEAKKEFTALK
ncbi:MAG: hypothetical protein LW817_06295 [Candidatus Caenarcaniphilales bacterium]|jgi:hypothetical protein|nr:hypothetical protein [Candidatus Caenarcaniphilales bacterium]